MAGVVVGVLVASAVGRVWGVHEWSIGLVIFFALLIGRALHLGAQGAVQVPVSALLVLLVGAAPGYGQARVVNTIIGAAAGVAVNVILPPLSTVSQAAAAIAGPVRVIAELLDDLAGLLEPRPGPTAVRLQEEATMTLLQRARAVGGTLKSARDQVDRVAEDARWNLAGRVHRTDVDRLTRLVNALDRIEVETRGIARTLADGAAAGVVITAPLARPLAALVNDAAIAVRALCPRSPDDPSSPDARAATDAHYVDLLDSTADIATGEKTAAWLLAAAVAVDAQRIVEESMAAPALEGRQQDVGRKSLRGGRDPRGGD